MDIHNEAINSQWNDTAKPMIMTKITESSTWQEIRICQIDYPPANPTILQKLWPIFFWDPILSDPSLPTHPESFEHKL